MKPAPYPYKPTPGTLFQKHLQACSFLKSVNSSHNRDSNSTDFDTEHALNFLKKINARSKLHHFLPEKKVGILKQKYAQVIKN